MSDASHWTDIVLAIASIAAVIVSIAAAIIACIARNDSKRSASEAVKARRIAQSDLLAPHFTNIGNVTIQIKKRNKFNTTSDKIVLAAESTAYLGNFLAHDGEMQTCLTKIKEMLTKPHPYGSEILYAASSGFSVERFYSEYGEAIKTFEHKQREYLSIE